MSQAQLADALGVHRSAVIAWEAGTAPAFVNAVAIADLFGVAVDSLLAPHDEDPHTDSQSRGERNRPHLSAEHDLAVTSGAAGAAQGE
jgi:transcriptional regulator with XRE-family HTH domain